MTWYQRRTEVLKMAETEPGWGCVRLVHERSIGRVVMTRQRGWRAGFYPLASADYSALGHFFGAKQRKQTRELPK